MSNHWRTPGSNQADDQNLEHGIPLEDFSNRQENARRFSTETQIRNGVRLSRNPDLGLRIIENISNLVYDCPICVETIEPGHAMWDCKNCHQVFHYPCIRQWANHGNLLGVSRWECPTCKHPSNRLPASTCWCTARPFPDADFTSRYDTPPNSCSGRCGRSPSNACPHSHICEKTCHPGPCSKCPRCPVPDPGANAQTAPPRRSSRPDTCCTLFLLALINIALVVWLKVYVKLITQPYNYPKWILDDLWFWHDFAVILVLTIASGSNVALSHNLIYQPPTGHPRESRPNKSQVLCRWLFVIFMLIWPIISFSEAPRGAWYKTMKNSCDGFDTRVTLDGEVTYNVFDSKMTPNTTLFLHSPGEKLPFPNLYIGTHIQYTSNSSDSYQYFFRVSGLTPQKRHISVDFDLDNRIWRMFHLNQTDLTNVWAAGNIGSSAVYHHQTSMTSAQFIKNGTWSNSTSKHSRSLLIPELELQIPHWWEFTQSCAYDPFLKVHRISDLSQEQIERQADRRWNKDSESTVVMRTASFGHGQKATDVCIKDQDWKRGGQTHRGLGDDMLVPLGLLAVYRLRLYNDNLRSFCFEDSYKPWYANQEKLT